MVSKMEKAPLGKAPIPATDLLDAIEPEDNRAIRELQVSRLVRTCAIDRSLAYAVVPLLHGEAA